MRPGYPPTTRAFRPSLCCSLLSNALARLFAELAGRLFGPGDRPARPGVRNQAALRHNAPKSLPPKAQPGELLFEVHVDRTPLKVIHAAAEALVIDLNSAGKEP
jgi:hypothetical protein